MSLSFSIEASDGKARAGQVKTAHGIFRTPAFMPVGTGGTVKAMTPDSLAASGSDIILANTYHLMLRPGAEIVRSLGGLGKMMGWPGPVLTDSGGFQVMSLAKLRKLTDEGVTFRSHIDGTEYFLSPEKSISVQEKLDSTISMVLDECTPYPCDYEYAEKSMYLTHRWLKRCCIQFDKGSSIYQHDQNLFPIIQGNTYKDLRIKSAEEIASLNRIGNAIGGLSVGEPKEIMYEMVEFVL